MARKCRRVSSTHRCHTPARMPALPGSTINEVAEVFMGRLFSACIASLRLNAEADFSLRPLRKPSRPLRLIRAAVRLRYRSVALNLDLPEAAEGEI